jgi:hypothetical protein
MHEVISLEILIENGKIKSGSIISARKPCQPLQIFQKKVRHVSRPGYKTRKVTEYQWLPLFCVIQKNTYLLIFSQLRFDSR